jgi:hypothetical protein
MLGLVAVHRLVPVSIRCVHNDVAGFIYAVLGVMYAILLAYVVIVVWQEFDTTSQIVDQEAVALEDIYHGVDQFADPQRSNVQDMVKSYIETTSDEEWPLLANGQSSPTANQLAHDLRTAIDALPATTPNEQVMFDHVLTQYEGFLQDRDLRIIQSQVGVHPMLWVLLIGGAVLTIGFTYFFGVENLVAHGIMIAALTLLIAALLFRVQQVNYPFQGQVLVSDEALRMALANLTG